jgi:hypothetical protein
MFQMRFVLLFLTLLALSIPGAGLSQDDVLAWPREIEVKKGTIVVYQPQIESIDGDHLSARAAVSVTPAGKNTPVFGAIWLDGRLEVDRDTRIATFIDVTVPDVKFPEVSDEQIAALVAIIETDFATWNMEMPLDDLIAAAEVVEAEQAISERLNNDPPKIVYRTEPSVLITIDGEPKMRDVEGSNLKYVGNTPFVIIQDGATFYLKGGEQWYTSNQVTEGWAPLRKEPPAAVAAFAAEQATPAEKDALDTSDVGDMRAEIPAIVVATEPTELVQVNGAPDFKSVEGTQLLYVQNSESDILMYIPSQEYFILLAGRWYKSRSLEDGTWKWVPFDGLPNDFINIPETSDMASVRASVPGTQEAREAVLDNSVPQTAEVDRATATVNVAYDGDPKFESIEGTSMSYAVNTNKSVLRIDGRYYCCDNAIWFESDSPNGPWTVSTVVPDDVQEIPPESPVYNVKYVHVYHYTPSVVYVGYTPGYYGSYYYQGCVVYGTGYWYRPWYSPYYYYPRPCTWGFGVHYNPYTGWGFSVGITNGWFSVRVGTGYGYWGPRGYYPGYRHGYHHGYRHGFYAGYRYANRPKATPYRNNLYRNNAAVRKTRDVAQSPAKRPSTRPGTRPSTRPSTKPGTRPSTKPSTRPNNVYADKNGNIHRRTSSGWETRNKGGWSKQPGTRDKTSQKNLNKQHESRQRSQARNKSYQKQKTRSQPQSRKQPSRSRSGGKRR